MKETTHIWKMSYLHQNHTRVDKLIEAKSDQNRNTIALSVLFERYRRHIGLDKVVFELVGTREE